MKKFLAVMMIAATTLSLGALPEAEAKRVGGGGSIGKQSLNVNRSAAQPAQAPKPAPAAAPAPAQNPGVTPPKPSPWKGILGGALLGLGLGALLSHFGIGAGLASAISSILMIALLAFAAMFIWRMVKRRNEPAARAAGTPFAFQQPDPGFRPAQDVTPAAQPLAFDGGNAASAAGAATGAAAGAAAAATDPVTWSIPAGFDTAGFLRHAKTYFIRLQAAWDRGDLNDLREFTTPEMFAELKMQLQERGTAKSDTDVQTLEAELLGIEETGPYYMASVRFVGTIREDGQPTEGFAEVWNLTKPLQGEGGWVLAGIQQI